MTVKVKMNRVVPRRKRGGAGSLDATDDDEEGNRNDDDEQDAEFKRVIKLIDNSAIHIELRQFHLKHLAAIKKVSQLRFQMENGLAGFRDVLDQEKKVSMFQKRIEMLRNEIDRRNPAFETDEEEEEEEEEESEDEDEEEEESEDEEDEEEESSGDDIESEENILRRRRAEEAHLATMAQGRLKREQKYDVILPTDVAHAGVWGNPGICSNPDDQISLESWSTVDAAEDVVSILPDKGNASQGGFCIKRGDLIDSMESTVVYRWIPNDPKEPEYGKADTKISYYRLPLGVRINQASFDLISQVPRIQSFQLKHIGQDLMGTERAVSAMHGSLEQVYQLLPGVTVKEFHRRQRVSSSKHPFKPQIRIPFKHSKSTVIETYPVVSRATSTRLTPNTDRTIPGFCRQFALDQTVNPQTNRKIKIGGPTHQTWTRRCQGFQGFR